MKSLSVALRRHGERNIQRTDSATVGQICSLRSHFRQIAMPRDVTHSTSRPMVYTWLHVAPKELARFSGIDRVTGR